MSEAGVPREWRFYVEDMVSFIDKALAYTQGSNGPRSASIRCAMTRLCAISN